MNWRKKLKIDIVPPSQSSLALGVIGLGYAWVLYFPAIGEEIRPYLSLLGFILVIPVLLKYLTSYDTFITNLKHPLNGSLMAPMTMTLLILCDYLAVIAPSIAYPIWFGALILHLTMMVIFFRYQLLDFDIKNIVPSWFLYPVGAISSSLAGTQFGYTVFSSTVVNVCIGIYFFMLPVVLYRLVFEGALSKRAKPTLALMAAPINLTMAAYLTNFKNPDPILTGALAGIGITMTLFIYLCYFRLLSGRFQPSMAALTFPSTISALAMHQLTSFFHQNYQQWDWLHLFGQIELFIATLLVIWVLSNYVKMYWNEHLKKHLNIKK